MRLFVGDDWAEDHHDVEVMDEAGRVLAKARLPEGVAGIARLHELVGRYLPEDAEDAGGGVGIETDRGPWVAALVAAGYRCIAVNPLQASRYRERHGVSGAKSDAGDSHMLADMVRTDRTSCARWPGTAPEAAAVKVVARTHKTLIWERTRQVQRLRHQLREYFPAALAAFEDLAAPDALELLGKAPDPARAARLTRAQVTAALKRARRRGIAEKADADPWPRCAASSSRLPARADRRLRRHRAVPGRGDHHLQRAGQGPGGAGGGTFWPAPGR